MKKVLNCLIIFTLILSMFSIPTYAKSNDIEVKIDVMADGRIVFNYDMDLEKIVESIYGDADDLEDYMDEIIDGLDKAVEELEEDKELNEMIKIGKLKTSGNRLIFQMIFQSNEETNVPFKVLEEEFETAADDIVEILDTKKSNLKDLNIFVMPTNMGDMFGEIFGIYLGEVDVLVSFQGDIKYSEPRLKKEESSLLKTYYSIKDSDNGLLYAAYKPQAMPTIIYIAIGIGILLVLIVVILLISKSKKKNMQSFEEPYVEVLEGEYKGAKIPLNSEGIIVGRDPDVCSLVYSPETKGVSRKHCKIEFDKNKNQFVITDFSTIGTYLKNDTKLQPGAPTYVSSYTELYIGGKSNQLRVVLLRK